MVALVGCGPLDEGEHDDPTIEGAEDETTEGSVDVSTLDGPTDVVRLLERAEDFKARARIEREAAHAIAARIGAPVRGPDFELTGLRADGLLEYTTTDNLVAAQTVKTDKVWPGGSGLGLNLTGSGRLIGVWDQGGVLTTHQEFGGRVVQGDSPASLSDHATHVAGTLIAQGVEPTAIGMAYQADLDAYDWVDDNDEMITAAAGGLRVSNHSYGSTAGWKQDQDTGDWYWYGDIDISNTEDWLFGFYNDKAQSWDEISYDAPMYLIVKSAGNDRNDAGPTPGTSHYVQDPSTGAWTLSTTARDPDGGAGGFDTIPSYGTSKNILTVGAVGDISAGYSVPSDVAITAYSGWGPTDDGRIKPDLVANGSGLESTITAADDAYDDKSGTSMAAPNVAGSVALLQQHYEDTFGKPPRSSMIKAIVIHTADEAGTADGPDYEHGWGLLNMAHAGLLIDHSGPGGSSSLLGGTLDEDNDSDSYTRIVTDDRNLVVTLCWTDPPGPVSDPSLDPSQRRLVNDLDLRVVRQSDGAIFEPWVLRPAFPTAAAIVGDNDRDNVEQVIVSVPTNGSYQILVDHKGSLTNGEQKYSLAVSQQQH